MRPSQLTTLALVLLFPFGLLKSQDQPLSFHLNYSIGIESYQEATTAPVDWFQSLHDDYATPDVAYSSWILQAFNAGVAYEAWSFAGAALDLGYAWGGYEPGNEGNAYYRGNSGLQLRDFRIQPSLYLDLLFNNENEALKLVLGGGLFHRTSETTHIAESDTASSPVLKDMVLARKGWAFNYFVGLEWEDYFSQNFGYFLGLRFVPSYRFEPTVLKVEKYRLHGEAAATEGNEFTYHNSDDAELRGNSIPMEEFIMNALYFNIGLKYRL